MKNAVLLIFALVITSLAAPKESGPKIGKRPDFTKTDVWVLPCFEPTAPKTTQKMISDLHKWGIPLDHFLHPDEDCTVPAGKWVLWLQMSEPGKYDTVQRSVSSSGSVVGYSSSGSSSQNQDMWGVEFSIELVSPDGKEERVAWDARTFGAGPYMMAGSASGNSYGDSFSISDNPSINYAVGNSVQQGSYHVIRGGWFIGAAEKIEAAAPKIVPAAPKTKATELAEQTANIQKQIQALKDEVRAQKEEERAAKKLHDAQKELDKLKTERARAK